MLANLNLLVVKYSSRYHHGYTFLLLYYYSRTNPLYIGCSSEDESQSKIEDSQMVMNVGDPDVREVKVEDDSECSSKKLDERSDLNFQPVFQSPLKGFSAERLLNIIVGKDVPTDKLCQSIPQAVRKHATFAVDTASMDCCCRHHIYGNLWKGHTKPRSKKVRD